MPIKDLSYTAGIIDGEGSICLIKRSTRYQKIFLSVSVGNTNEWLIQWLKMQYGGDISTSKNKTGSTMWHWDITRYKASNFLKLILPYLRIKRPQAELAIKFQARKRKGPMADGQAVIQEAERLLMKSYNTNKKEGNNVTNKKS